MLSRALPLVVAASLGSLLVQLSASTRSAAFDPPTFVRQWEIAPTGPPNFDTHAATTSSGASSTTTTTLPCTSANCTFAAAITNPPCAGEAVPPSVTKRFASAAGFIAQAQSSPVTQARRLLRRAKNVLNRAKTKVARAARGRNPKISSDCAAALRNAGESVAEGLGV